MRSTAGPGTTACRIGRQRLAPGRPGPRRARGRAGAPTGSRRSATPRATSSGAEPGSTSSTPISDTVVARLRARQPSALDRHDDEPDRPARDGGRAGQLRVGLDGRLGLPGRTATPMAAQRRIGFSTSSDGGRTWRSGLLPGLTPPSPRRDTATASSDPVVAYDADARRLARSRRSASPPTRSRSSSAARRTAAPGPRRPRPPGARRAPGQGVDRLRQLADEPAPGALLPLVSRRRRPGRSSRASRRMPE